MNLRKEVPDGTQWDAAWHDAYILQQQLAPGAICCMGMPVRQRLFKTVRAMGAKSVLDIGTYIGYSALNFALAVGEGGRVVTVDITTDHFKAAGALDPEELWTRAGVRRAVTRVKCDSLKFMHGTAEKFDFICIDGWHEDFAVYGEILRAFDMLKPDGLVFLDDVQDLTYEPPPGSDRFYGPARAVARVLDERKDVRFERCTETTGFMVRR